MNMKIHSQVISSQNSRFVFCDDVYLEWMDSVPSVYQPKDCFSVPELRKTHEQHMNDLGITLKESEALFNVCIHTIVQLNFRIFMKT